jgi:hypothetical protein
MTEGTHAGLAQQWTYNDEINGYLLYFSSKMSLSAALRVLCVTAIIVCNGPFLTVATHLLRTFFSL